MQHTDVRCMPPQAQLLQQHTAAAQTHREVLACGSHLCGLALVAPAQGRGHDLGCRGGVIVLMIVLMIMTLVVVVAVGGKGW